MKKLKFKKQYVLGEGYPWFFGLNDMVKQIGLTEKPVGTNFIWIPIPKELMSPQLPKYELILRRVKEVRDGE